MSRAQNRVAVITGTRTPYVRGRSTFTPLGTLDLGVIVCREVMYRAEIQPSQVDETILSQGCLWPQHPHLAQSISVLAGIPEDKPSFSLNQGDASGLQSIAASCERIQSRDRQLVIAGGVEAPSQYPWLFSQSFFQFMHSLGQTSSIWGRFVRMLRFKFSYLWPQDLIRDYCLQTYRRGERLAQKFGISRLEQDRFAMRSHRHSIQAQEEERFHREIVPVHIGPDFEVCIEKDQGPKENLSIESLTQVPSQIGEEGSVTKDNSSFLSDGAAALALASEKFLNKNSRTPIGYIRSYGFAGSGPQEDSLPGVLAAKIALDKSGHSLSDMDLIEIHEDSAAGVLAHLKAFSSREYSESYLNTSQPLGEIDLEKLNTNGGAISLGHSIGSTGIRMVTTLLGELERRDKKFGLAVISSGSSQGGALIVEREV